MALPKSALIVVDFQEDFCPPNGSLAVPEGRDIAPLINALLDLPFTIKIATRDAHPPNHCSFASQHPGAKPFTSQHTIRNPENEAETQTTTLWPDHCVSSTAGSDLLPELHAVKLDYTLSKGHLPHVESYSAFGPPFRNPPYGMTELNDKLKEAGVQNVFICGLAFGFCVKCTAMDAAEFGYRTFVVVDATRGGVSSESELEKAREELRGVGVKLVESEGEEVRGMVG